MPATDPNTLAHLEWLGFIQPHGVVVSPPALLKAGGGGRAALSVGS